MRTIEGNTALADAPQQSAEPGLHVLPQADAEPVPTGSESAQEAPATLVSESVPERVANVEADAVPEVRPDIDAATSVDELIAMLEQMDGQGPQIEAIRETQMYLQAHMTEIISGVLNKGNATYRDMLGQTLARISDARLREKTRGLLKRQMEAAFRDRRQDFVQTAVRDATSFDQLAGVIRQFRSVNTEGEGSTAISATQALELVETARRALQVKTADKPWLKMVDQALEADLDQIVANVPSDSGIRNRVRALLWEQVKEARLQSVSDDASADASRPGLMGRIRRGLGSLFGRRSS